MLFGYCAAKSDDVRDVDVASVIEPTLNALPVNAYPEYFEEGKQEGQDDDRNRIGVAPRGMGRRFPEARLATRTDSDDAELGEGFLFGYLEADGRSGAAGDSGFGFFDTAKEDASELVCGFVVQAQVRVLFHHIEGVAKFVHEIRVCRAVQHTFILSRGLMLALSIFLQHLRGFRVWGLWKTGYRAA